MSDCYVELCIYWWFQWLDISVHGPLGLGLPNEQVRCDRSHETLEKQPSQSFLVSCVAKHDINNPVLEGVASNIRVS